MAIKRLEVYKCAHCGNIVETVKGGPGQLVCCGVPMSRLDENTVDAAKEKHVPVVEKMDGGFRVKVGDVAHPMADNHYIEWIELIDGDKVYREYLNPGATPVATFLVAATNVRARAYCNLHGLWQA